MSIRGELAQPLAFRGSVAAARRDHGGRSRAAPLADDAGYHTPKQRQFVITISGAVEITCAGGTRVFGPGDVLFAEDLKGEGHSNRELHGPRMSLIIQVTEDFDIRRFTKPR